MPSNLMATCVRPCEDLYCLSCASPQLPRSYTHCIFRSVGGKPRTTVLEYQLMQAESIKQRYQASSSRTTQYSGMDGAKSAATNQEIQLSSFLHCSSRCQAGDSWFVQ